ARIDFVGMGGHRLVGFEDDRVLGALALAVVRFGDLPEIVAFLYRVHLCFGRCFLGRELVVYLGHAHGVAQRQRDFFGLFGGCGLARFGDFVAVVLDFQAICIQPMLGEFILHFVHQVTLRL